MIISFTDYGEQAKLIITSSRLTLRKHNRVVDAVLLCVHTGHHRKPERLFPG